MKSFFILIFWCSINSIYAQSNPKKMTLYVDGLIENNFSIYFGTNSNDLIEIDKDNIDLSNKNLDSVVSFIVIYNSDTVMFCDYSETSEKFKNMPKEFMKDFRVKYLNQFYLSDNLWEIYVDSYPYESFHGENHQKIVGKSKNNKKQSVIVYHLFIQSSELKVVKKQK